MDEYICLLLNRARQVVFVTELRGPLDGATETARGLAAKHQAHGFELWHNEQRVASSDGRTAQTRDAR